MARGVASKRVVLYNHVGADLLRVQRAGPNSRVVALKHGVDDGEVLQDFQPGRDVHIKDGVRGGDHPAPTQRCGVAREVAAVHREGAGAADAHQAPAHTQGNVLREIGAVERSIGCIEYLHRTSEHPAVLAEVAALHKNAGAELRPKGSSTAIIRVVAG